MIFFSKYLNALLYSAKRSHLLNQLYLLSFFCLVSLYACQSSVSKRPIDDLALDHFLNKSSIYLYGRKPYAKEIVEAKWFFSEKGFTQPSREEYLMKMSTTNEYKLYLYQLGRNDLMNFIFNPDTVEIQNTIHVWTKLYPNDYGKKEIVRLKRLLTISQDLLNDSLDNIGLHKRLVHNSYYDFINMGTENFVISMYNNFLDRPPTKYELTQGKLMVDGSDALFLGKKGSSKEDFIAMFFDSYLYYEGQVRMLYKRYYYTEPPAEYLTALTLEYYKTKNLRKIQAKLLSGDLLIAS